MELERHRDYILLRNPIPIPALKHINTWLVPCGDGRFLAVDPGMGEASARALAELFRRSGWELEAVVATHFHVDHLTAAGWLNARLCMGWRDWRHVEWMVSTWPEAAKSMEDLFRSHGMPASEAGRVAEKHPALSRIKWFEKVVERHSSDIVALREGNELPCKGLHVVEVPGHTPGHIALSSEDGVVLVGDTVLVDITPNIPMLFWDSDPLGDYLASLEKIEALGPRVLLPGHRRPIDDPAGRIAELREHHRRRLSEIVEILRVLGEATGYEIAKRMSWDVPYESWDEYPLAQKYFALAEALSHLKRLVVEGLVEPVERGEVIVFRLKQGAAQPRPPL